MNKIIRKMCDSDKNEVIHMMNVFYSSDAVYTNGSIEIFENDSKDDLSRYKSWEFCYKKFQENLIDEN